MQQQATRENLWSSISSPHPKGGDEWTKYVPRLAPAEAATPRRCSPGRFFYAYPRTSQGSSRVRPYRIPSEYCEETVKTLSPLECAHHLCEEFLSNSNKNKTCPRGSDCQHVHVHYNNLSDFEITPHINDRWNFEEQGEFRNVHDYPLLGTSSVNTLLVGTRSARVDAVEYRHVLLTHGASVALEGKKVGRHCAKFQHEGSCPWARHCDDIHCIPPVGWSPLRWTTKAPTDKGKAGKGKGAKYPLSCNHPSTSTVVVVDTPAEPSKRRRPEDIIKRQQVATATAPAKKTAGAGVAPQVQQQVPQGASCKPRPLSKLRSMSTHEYAVHQQADFLRRFDDFAGNQRDDHDAVLPGAPGGDSFTLPEEDESSPLDEPLLSPTYAIASRRRQSGELTVAALPATTTVPCNPQQVKQHDADGVAGRVNNVMGNSEVQFDLQDPSPLSSNSATPVATPLNSAAQEGGKWLGAMAPAYQGHRCWNRGPTPPHGTTGALANGAATTNATAQITRFPPPPPPSARSLQILESDGSEPGVGRTIAKRWYKKQLSSQMAHPQIPPPGLTAEEMLEEPYLVTPRRQSRCEEQSEEGPLKKEEGLSPLDEPLSTSSPTSYAIISAMSHLSPENLQAACEGQQFLRTAAAAAVCPPTIPKPAQSVAPEEHCATRSLWPATTKSGISIASTSPSPEQVSPIDTALGTYTIAPPPFHGPSPLPTCHIATSSSSACTGLPVPRRGDVQPSTRRPPQARGASPYGTGTPPPPQQHQRGSRDVHPPLPVPSSRSDWMCDPSQPIFCRWTELADAPFLEGVDAEV